MVAVPAALLTDNAHIGRGHVDPSGVAWQRRAAHIATGLAWKEARAAAAGAVLAVCACGKAIVATSGTRADRDITAAVSITAATSRIECAAIAATRCITATAGREASTVCVAIVLVHRDNAATVNARENRFASLCDIAVVRIQWIEWINLL